MLVQSLRLQCGAREARAAERGGFELPRLGRLIARSTQLIRAAATGDLQRARRLIQLGANLDLVDSFGYSALHWASIVGHEHVAKTLLDGKYNGCAATVELRDSNG